MTRHVQQTRARASGRHRAESKPRYGRIATLGSSLAVVVVAVLGSNGALPSSAEDQPDQGSVASGEVGGDGGSSGQGSGENPGKDSSQNAGPESGDDSGDDTGKKASEEDDPSSEGSADAGDEPGDTQKAGNGGGQETDDTTVADQSDTALPSDSGSGKRVVFSEGRQRVWLVSEDETVERTYLVSGSAYDNLDPGSFQVYSRDEEAVGIDDSGTMRLFVRFTQGPSGAAIGFHDIPVDNGVPVQSVDQLGLPMSHGCIRQRTEDAQALWDFAPIGTAVVVTP